MDTKPNSYYDDVPEGNKRCAGGKTTDKSGFEPCGEVKPLSDFGKLRSSPDSLQPLCKICTNTKRRRGKLIAMGIDPESVRPGTKPCTGKFGCGRVLPFDQFPKRSDGKLDHLCQSCANARAKAGLEQWELRYRKFHDCGMSEEGEATRKCGYARNNGKKGGCKKVLTLSQFDLDERTVDGLNEICRPCIEKRKKKTSENLLRNGKPKIQIYFGLDLIRELPLFETRRETLSWIEEEFEKELLKYGPVAILNTATKLGYIAKNEDGDFYGANTLSPDVEEELSLDWVLSQEEEAVIEKTGNPRIDAETIWWARVEKLEPHLNPDEYDSLTDVSGHTTVAEYNRLVRLAAERMGEKPLDSRMLLTPDEQDKNSRDSAEEGEIVFQKLKSALGEEISENWDNLPDQEYNRLLRKAAELLGMNIPDWPFDESVGEQFYLNPPRFWGGKLS